MKKTIKWVSLLLTLLMVLSALPFTASAAAIHHEDNFDWVLAGSTLSIMPREGTDCVYDDDSDIYPYMNQIETVIIGEGIKELMPGAFRWYNHIEKAVIPSTCKSLVYEAFHDCTALVDVTIANGVENIECEAFEGCTALETIEIPGSVKTLESSAFYACTALKEVYLNEGLQTIGEEVFCGCPQLPGVVVPASVRTIEPHALGYTYNGTFNKVSGFSVGTCGTGTAAETYAGANGFPTINVYDFSSGGCTVKFNPTTGALKISATGGDTYIHAGVMHYYKSLLKSVELSGSITELLAQTFKGCPLLTSVKLNSGLKRIGNACFADCPQLKSIAIPDSVDNIGVVALGFVYNAAHDEYTLVPGFTVSSSCSNEEVRDYVEDLLSDDFAIKWSKTHRGGTSTVVKPTANALGYTAHKCACGETYKDTFKAQTGKVSGFKCAARTQAAEKFTWTAMKGVTGYQIQISNAAGTAWGSAYATTANSYLFKGLSAGSKYKFRIRTFIKAPDGKNYFGPWVTLTSPTLPAATTLKVAAGNKAFTAQWTKKAVNGYQLQYSIKSSFSGAKTVNVKNAGTVKYVVKSLKAKTTYYVRIRTYKIINKANYFSTWTTAKVKTK